MDFADDEPAKLDPNFKQKKPKKVSYIQRR